MACDFDCHSRIRRISDVAEAREECRLSLQFFALRAVVMRALINNELDRIEKEESL